MDILRWVTWNTFLAVIPVVLAYIIYKGAGAPGKRKLPKAVLAVLGLAWLAFLPNTCYLLTEWRHFLDVVGRSGLYTLWRVDGDAAYSLMIQTVFYFCYSAIGMITFTLAIRPIAKMVRSRGFKLWIWAMPLFLMLSVGVYLGLILRYNSWDLITRPGEVWSSVVALADRPRLSTFIVAFGGFLWLAYSAMDIWVEGFLNRWRQWWNIGN